MALVGKVNREIVASINRHGSYAVGLSGEDAGLITVSMRDERLGFVGDVSSIDPSIVRAAAQRGPHPGDRDDRRRRRPARPTTSTPTPSPARSREALDAEKLVYLTDVAGLYADYPDESTLISQIDVAGLERARGRRQAVGGDDPEDPVVRRRAATTACGAPTSSTAASRTRCCSSSSPVRASAR